MRSPLLASVTSLVVLVLLAGCAQPAPGPLQPAPSPTTSSVETPTAPVDVVGTPTTVVSGLAAPWSMLRLDSGSTLISERDTRLVKELTADGQLRDVGTVEGASPGGEGGLLGLATLDQTGLYVYLTTATDNRIVRFELEGTPGAYSLGASRDILTGLQKAGNHNGGRIAFGPDGMLYATVGDAGTPASAQDLDSLNGKILRMEPDGSVPDDNPFAGSLVYSLGHRNPQGIAWDDTGQLWATEFGQNTWDEFNIIRAGANYGWPAVEGAFPDDRFESPIYQWATDEASPSGLTYVRGTFFMAALGGERLWAIHPGDPTTAIESFADTLGRIRDVTPGPDGSLWMLTNNTDGRGQPREGDDRIVQVELAPAP
jgi:glucose/arabinose dehydrogenase